MRKGLIIYRVNDSQQGIINKQRMQAEAMASYGYEMDMLRHRDRALILNDESIMDIDFTSRWNLLRFFLICKKALDTSRYDIVYIRYAPYSTGLRRLVRHFKKQGAKVYLELPTYPYQEEYSGLKRQFLNLLTANERFLLSSLDGIIHYGTEQDIKGQKVINMHNGTLPNYYPVVATPKENSEIRLVYVGAILQWQGVSTFLRLIEEFTESTDRKVQLTQVGGATEQSPAHWHKVLPPTYGKPLDEILADCHLAIGVLNDYRSYLTRFSPLKHREYLIRGLPVICTSLDHELVNCPFAFILKESHTLEDVLAWYDDLLSTYPHDLSIRISNWAEEHLNWKLRFSFLKP